MLQLGSLQQSKTIQVPGQRVGQARINDGGPVRGRQIRIEIAPALERPMAARFGRDQLRVKHQFHPLGTSGIGRVHDIQQTLPNRDVPPDDPVDGSARPEFGSPPGVRTSTRSSKTSNRTGPAIV